MISDKGMTIADQKTCIIVPNYGAAFEGMLMACLESVAHASPGTRIYVYGRHGRG